VKPSPEIIIYSLFKCLKLRCSKVTIFTLEYIRKTLNEYGSNENVLSIIEEIVKTTASQIQVIWNNLWTWWYVFCSWS